MLRNKGESEVAASLYLSGRLEGSVAYSPVKHVLVRAAGGLLPSNGDSVDFHIRQFELGTGTYWSLSDRWLVGAMGGYGRGQSNRRFKENDFEYFGPDTVISFNYAARFNKVFGEAFVAYEGEWATVGAAYRLSQVRFSSLTNNGSPVDLRRMTRSEPMLFMRFGNRSGFLPWGQFQLAVSTSSSPGYRGDTPLELQLDDIKQARVFTSIGFFIYPHRLKKFTDD
ncbi:hypothetical protein H8B13_09230 [Hymenobacter sp. BT188]|uniref:hypothetical protein n=1 Tax=Hymenobacter sp. BT188 TaxID=2763504 RepID=UPI0016511360|nr:hypothetical protein [Hymenobacter sp. BT188]MBC6606999.1 hypothetical protein [Hymenobacter sp. BT188]